MSSGTMRVVLAIDPGSAKCGLAAVQENGEILYRSIVATSDILEKSKDLSQKFNFHAIVLGDGTSSKTLRAALEQTLAPLPLQMMEETNTTLLARERYLAENPPRGWQRLLPHSLRSPDVPIDDYAAVLLGERFWESQSRR
jgi:RNase H-fold protein (predicted Holliday junction resolvase)